MIKLTYIYHSCFVLESEQSILIFDYWMDPANVLNKYISKNRNKHVYVFASHFHEDHFTKEIFKWKKDYHFSHFIYILSKDILRHRRAQKEDADVWLAKGGKWEDDNIKVAATGSNDSGVSWIIEIEGKRIFHAGDLCNWYARFLDGRTLNETIYSEDFEKYINPVDEEKRFLGELKDIHKITNSFDIAMFPIDGRIGNGYTLGARQFIEHFKIGLLVPMHFVMSGFESTWRMNTFCKEKNIPFWCIQYEGEDIVLKDNTIIRKSSINDIPRLKEIFTIARRFMTETGNPNQWDANYPNENQLREDIESNNSYVIQQGGNIVATFVLRSGIDTTYNEIYNGSWPNELPYATIHRIASDGTTKGIFHLAIQFAIQKYNNIRIDTHNDNRVMQNAILKEGFKYCGIIHCWNGGERLAYQLTKIQTV